MAKAEKEIFTKAENTVVKAGMSEATKDKFKLGSKYALTLLAESGAKEVLSYGIDQLSEVGMEKLKPMIAE